MLTSNAPLALAQNIRFAKPAYSVSDQWAALGALRFFLALVVCCYHLSWFDPSSKLLSGFSQFGPSTSVMAFFVISGYSIAHSIMKQPAGFYQRRIARLYPCYFIAVVLAAIPFLMAGPILTYPNGGSIEGPSSSFALIGQFLMLQGIVTQLVSTVGQSWSLAYESLWYAAAPLLRQSPPKYLVGSIAICALAFSLHSTLGLNWIARVPWQMILLTGWLWVGGFCYYRFQDESWANWMLLIGIVVSVVFPVERFPFGSLAFPILLLCLRFDALGFRLSKPVSKSCNYLGDLSYPLYILHFQIVWIWTLATHGRYESGLVLLGIALFGSLTIYHGFDLPYRAYLKRSVSGKHLTAGKSDIVDSQKIDRATELIVK